MATKQNKQNILILDDGLFFSDRFSGILKANGHIVDVVSTDEKINDDAINSANLIIINLGSKRVDIIQFVHSLANNTNIPILAFVGHKLVDTYSKEFDGFATVVSNGTINRDLLTLVEQLTTT